MRGDAMAAEWSGFDRRLTRVEKAVKKLEELSATDSDASNWRNLIGILGDDEMATEIASRINAEREKRRPVRRKKQCL